MIKKKLDRHVDLTTLDDDVQVSTILLPFCFDPGEEYETMVFGGKYDNYCWRHHTQEEAAAEHARVVAALQEGTNPDA